MLNAVIPILILLGSAHRGTQDPPQEPVPPLPPEVEDTEPLLASDGEPVAPGRIPEGTSTVAVERWGRTLRGLGLGPDSGRPRITDFDLSVDVVHRRPGSSNESEAGLRYLEGTGGPFLRVYLERKDLVVLRGPTGDWLVDGDEVKDLAGREGAEDRALLDEYAGLCRNFLSLTRPDQVRIVRIEEREVAPRTQETDLAIMFQGDEIPVVFPQAQIAEEARGLRWLLVQSPDFQILGSPEDNGAERALFGLDPGTDEVRLAILGPPGDGPMVGAGSVLVLLGRYRDLEGGWRVPRSLSIRPVDRTSLAQEFSKLEAIELWLKNASRLNTGLGPRAFLPPR